ncbi:hypothetical protein Pta02_59650 [Planobispora takensis]|uniref:DUF2510 domain-containing protein n=2 Tax=Planobispora takensis TaxID=1367882 RepID=A0A8J3T2J2_9ACTN|nr:hypothetical protein Pta02_59650 [Planobispora takensis]
MQHIPVLTTLAPMTTQTPAGWYPDPYGSPHLRWWDGSQWTDATHQTDAPAGQAAAPGPQTGPSSPPAGPQGTGPQYSPAPPQGTGPQYSPAPPQGTGPQHAPLPPQGTGPQYPPIPPQGGGTAQLQQPSWGGAPGDTAQMPSPGYGPQGAFPGPQGAFPGPQQPAKKSPLPWILGGTGAVVLVVGIVVAAMFVFNPDRTRNVSSPTSAPTASQQQPTPDPTPSSTPTPTEPAQSPPATELPQPEAGRVSDSTTGLSYEYPDDRWQVPPLSGPDQLGFTWTSGIVTTSHENYDGKGGNWLGNVYTGELPDAYSYDGVQSMKATAATLLHAFEPVFYKPQHLRKVVENKAIEVSGKPAWQFTLDFDFSRSSEAYGWKWKKERVTFVLVDRGAGKRPAVLYMSIPDNLDFSVTSRVLKSLKLS